MSLTLELWSSARLSGLCFHEIEIAVVVPLPENARIAAFLEHSPMNRASESILFSARYTFGESECGAPSAESSPCLEPATSSPRTGWGTSTDAAGLSRYATIALSPSLRLDASSATRCAVLCIRTRLEALRQRSHQSWAPERFSSSANATHDAYRTERTCCPHRGTEQVTDGADTLEPLAGVPPATEALRELRRAWVRLAGGSRDDPAGALAPLSVRATVRVEGLRRAAEVTGCDRREVAPMVGSVLLRHAL
jgi:hypothetical protein